MRRILLFVFGLALAGACPQPAVASPALVLRVAEQGTATITLAWDASPPDPVVPAGYKIKFGTASGAYASVQDVGLATTWTVTLPIPAVDTTYYFIVVAYVTSPAYLESGPSNEVAAIVPSQPPPPGDMRCAYPTGDRAVSIFPTRLQGAVAGNRLTVSFQLASPNSPIVHIDVRVNGLSAKGVDGSDLTDVGAMWFKRPSAPGMYVLSLYATNAYGCARDQATTFVFTVK